MSDPNTTQLAQLSATDRKLLQMSVHLNPMIVANADGEYSFRETSALAEATRTLITEERYRPLVLVAGSEDLSDAAVRVMLETHSRDIDGYLARVASLIDLLPSDAAEAYRRFTIFSIVKVAEASRDGLFGLLGDRISQSEKKVMKKMVAVLALPLDEDVRGKLGM